MGMQTVRPRLGCFSGENNITKILINFLHVTSRWQYLYTKNHPCSLFGGRDMNSGVPKIIIFRLGGFGEEDPWYSLKGTIAGL